MSISTSPFRHVASLSLQLSTLPAPRKYITPASPVLLFKLGVLLPWHALTRLFECSHPRRYITPSSWMSYALIANQLGGNEVLVADDFRGGELVRMLGSDPSWAEIGVHAPLTAPQVRATAAPPAGTHSSALCSHPVSHTDPRQ